MENMIRIPPQNLEAEQALLGAILSNNRALEKVSEFLRSECFANPVHGKIYEACRLFIEQGRIADPITLKAFFEGDNSLKDIGGASYLAELAAASTNIINATDYGRQILDRYLRRQMIALGTDIVNDAFAISINEEAIEQVEHAEKRLYEIANSGEMAGGPQQLNQALQLSLQTVQHAMNTPSGVSGVSTGLIDMDNLLSGLHNSDLLILAGRPAMGKSALALTMAYNAAVKFEEENRKNTEKKSVVFFSLEMSAEQLASRILSAKAQVPGHLMRSGKLTDEQFDELAAGVSLLNRLPLYIDETPGMTVTGIKNRARRMKRDKEKGLGLIVIDYLQLITAGGGRNENRVQELSEMTRQLKIMAKELNVPVLVLSQLSRLVEQRDNKRPLLSDLRESGSIEQDADIVMFVYREIYYLQNEVPVKHLNETPEKFEIRKQEWEAKKLELANQAEAIIAKQRHGPVGTVKLYFNGEFGKFGNLQQPE
ncbi:MAG: replicative DNA helicase [Alphaproteobacteria bacterium]|nr:replicative DNA helicase [Alphaproteobacteria bacterium]